MLLIMALVGGAIIGFIVATIFYVAFHPSNTDLNSGSTGSILGAGPARPKRTAAKHVPKANTDLIAYHKEIQEQGDNRV